MKQAENNEILKVFLLTIGKEARKLFHLNDTAKTVERKCKDAAREVCKNYKLYKKFLILILCLGLTGCSAVKPFIAEWEIVPPQLNENGMQVKNGGLKFTAEKPFGRGINASCKLKDGNVSEAKAELEPFGSGLLPKTASLINISGFGFGDN